MRQQPFASPEEALAQLQHHGVKGMRWGVRKKEETSGDDSAKPELSEKTQRKVEKFQQRADVMGAKISELKVSNEAQKEARGLTQRYQRHIVKQDIKALQQEQKRALNDVEAVQTKYKLTSKQKKVLAGVAVGGVLVAVVAINRGQQSGALNSYALRGSAFLRGQKTPFATNPKLSGKMSAHDLLHNVAKPVNPGYAQAGGKMNCRRSTYAYELRRRGFDVHATTSAVGWGQSESGVINAVTPGSRNFYRQMSMSTAVVRTGGSTVASGDKRKSPLTKILLDKLDTGGPNGETTAFGTKRVFQELTKQPNGSRGEVLFKFPNFGHSMAYEIVDGKPHIFDSQKGTYHDLIKTVESKWGNFGGAEITRLDNADLDLNFLTRWANNY